MTETKWLTIAEASLLSSEMGLNRSTKTIRTWARSGHVEARKKSTTHGEMWILDKTSLETKINTEIEYRDQTEAVQTRANPSAPVQTGSDPFEPVQTKADPFSSENEHHQGSDIGSNPREPRSQSSSQVQIRDLEDQVLLLTNDVKWRDRVLKEQKNANDVLLNEVKGQSRYIGHLETNLVRLGVKPDQTFLEAPTPNSKREESEPAPEQKFDEPEIIQPRRPHPDQQSFPPRYMG